MSNSRHRLITSVFTVILAGATLTPAAAQTATTGSADRAVQIAQTRRANGALMHHFAWNSRVEVVINGQVKDTKIEQLSYDSSGQLQTLLLNDQKASRTYLPTPIGFLRKAIAEDKEKEMVAFLTGLKGMLGQYTLSTAGKILDFMTTATATGPNANGLLQLTGNNVVVPGDNLTLLVNPWTQHVTQMMVNTSFQGAPAQLTATFETLPGPVNGGLNYVSFAEVTVPSKQLSVQVQNYNFNRLY